MTYPSALVILICPFLSLPLVFHLSYRQHLSQCLQRAKKKFSWLSLVNTAKILKIFLRSKTAEVSHLVLIENLNLIMYTHAHPPTPNLCQPNILAQC